mmetsp:Transcript_40369/g.79065  ORF Transcript_40369/g.79065 Transcript_40369/m.79065 type:complete len:209 (-) Transcript_40369:26-652(-)
MRYLLRPFMHLLALLQPLLRPLLRTLQPTPWLSAPDVSCQARLLNPSKSSSTVPERTPCQHHPRTSCLSYNSFCIISIPHVSVGDDRNTARLHDIADNPPVGPHPRALRRPPGVNRHSVDPRCLQDANQIESFGPRLLSADLARKRGRGGQVATESFENVAREERRAASTVPACNSIMFWTSHVQVHTAHISPSNLCCCKRFSGSCCA